MAWDDIRLDGMSPDRVGRAVFNMMMSEVEANCRAHGWYDGEDANRPFPTEIALLHSEVSEALESWRKRGFETMTVHKSEDGCGHDGGFQLGVKPGDPDYQPYSCRRASEPHKREGVGPELAGLLIRLLDTCTRVGVDLYAEYRLEMEYNKTRPHRHGGRAV